MVMPGMGERFSCANSCANPFQVGPPNCLTVSSLGDSKRPKEAGPPEWLIELPRELGGRSSLGSHSLNTEVKKKQIK